MKESPCSAAAAVALAEERRPAEIHAETAAIAIAVMMWQSVFIDSRKCPSV